MELIESNDGWLLRFDEGRVNYIHIDFRLALDFVDGTETSLVTIETTCRLKGPDVDVPITPAESSSLAPVLPLFNANVAGIAIGKTGYLKVEFGDGRALEVAPDNSYEAWQLGCSLGFMMVCSPGGPVSLFRDNKRPGRFTNPGCAPDRVNGG